MKKETNEIKAKAGRKFPHIFVILFAIILLAMIATYIVPSGQYARYLDEASGKNLIDPLTFEYIENTPVNPFQMFVCIEEGMIDAANIIFLVFCAYSSLYLLESTGAINAALAIMVKATRKNKRFSNVILVISMVAITLWATTGTISWEEMIAFVPLFVSLALALGYDPLVGLGIAFFPLATGYACGCVNPFNTGVAQTIAELPMFSGMGFRVCALAVMGLATILFIMTYAASVKKNPEKSLVYGIDYSDLDVDEEVLSTEFTKTRKLSLVALLVAVLFMAYGLIRLNWYVNQVAGIFLCLDIALGIINKMKPSQVAETLSVGISKAAGAGCVVGIARGVLIILQKGMVIDTIVHSCVGVLSGLPIWLSSIGMLVFQTLLNFLIPSASGQASVSMPLITPIADLLGMSRQLAVFIFQMGDGFSNNLWPTFLIPIACSMVNVPLNKYYKFAIRWIGIIFALQVVFIYVAIATNWGAGM